jgi:Uma2 family endonuclease
MVHAVIPESMIAERHRLGHDVHDEMWEGVLHMVPPGSDEHYRLEAELLVRLHPLAKARGLHIRNEAGLFDPTKGGHRSYRVPDLMIFGDAVRSARGAEGAALLVVEIRSPDDDSFEKIPFYSRVGVAELLIIDRDSKEVRLWTRLAAGLEEAAAGGDGWHQLAALPVAIRGGRGRLEVRYRDQVEEI